MLTRRTCSNCREHEPYTLDLESTSPLQGELTLDPENTSRGRTHFRTYSNYLEQTMGKLTLDPESTNRGRMTRSKSHSRSQGRTCSRPLSGSRERNHFRLQWGTQTNYQEQVMVKHTLDLESTDRGRTGSRSCSRSHYRPLFKSRSRDSCFGSCSESRPWDSRSRSRYRVESYSRDYHLKSHSRDYCSRSRPRVESHSLDSRSRSRPKVESHSLDSRSKSRPRVESHSLDSRSRSRPIVESHSRDFRSRSRDRVESYSRDYHSRSRPRVESHSRDYRSRSRPRVESHSRSRSKSCSRDYCSRSRFRSHSKSRSRSRGGTYSKYLKHKNYPKCKFELMNHQKPYLCDGCKEQGYGSRYTCVRYNVELHKECMFPSYKTSHECFPGCTFKFLNQTPGRDERYCDACGMAVKGFVYHCKRAGKDLHPCCRCLKNKIEIDGVGLKLCSNKVPKKKCSFCKKKELPNGVPGIPGWSYVSKTKSDNYNFHVHCTMEWVIDSWKNIGPQDNNHLTLENLALTELKADSIERDRKGSKYLRIAILVLKCTVSTLLGDPSQLLFSGLDLLSSLG